VIAGINLLILYKLTFWWVYMDIGHSAVLDDKSLPSLYS